MDFLELAKKRYSVRKYLPREVEPEKLDYIMECARLAPSAHNFQPWFFYIIKSDEAKEAVKNTYQRNWITSSPPPVFILACSNNDQSWKREFDYKDHGDIDIAIAFEHICLAATEKGLGTCWICNFDPSIIKELLKLPENMTPIAITPIGYIDESEAKKHPRKSTDEIMTVL